MKQEISKDIYLQNEKKSKWLKRLAPIVFWGGLVLSLFFLIMAFQNSFGNIAEIISRLDAKNQTAEQLNENYMYLIDKFGEWNIGSGSTGFTMKFIDIRSALFSGFLYLYATLSVISFIGAFVLGKWLFPMLSKSIIENTQRDINLKVFDDKDKKENKIK